MTVTHYQNKKLFISEFFPTYVIDFLMLSRIHRTHLKFNNENYVVQYDTKHNVINCFAVFNTVRYSFIHLTSSYIATCILQNTGTEARDDFAIVNDLYPNLSGSNFNPLTVSIVEGLYAMVIIRSKSGNMLNRTVLAEVKTMLDFIQTIETKDDTGATIKVF